MKDKTTAALLALFLGGLGAHKFYLGKTFFGILYLLFCWTWIPAIVGFIEGIVYLSMSENSFQEKYGNKTFQNPQKSQFTPSGQTNSFSQPSQQTTPYIPGGYASTSQRAAYTPLTIPREVPTQSPKMIPPEPEVIDVAHEEIPSVQNESSFILSDEEKEYLEEFKTYVLDGEISDKERRLLDKLRELSGISKERAEYIENNYNKE